ncbi:peptidoglycan-binding domain-containing protein [Clostridium paraputrificum]|uniref:peptidoglycan-binding domain-containing protein n=1 Tax=Clostridium TaxID=1485 RepID=UPI003D32DFEA
MYKLRRRGRLIILGLCFVLFGGPLVTYANVNPVLVDMGGSIIIEGRNFTYENAPEAARLEHEENCRFVGIEPSPSDPIFIPKEAFGKYGVSTASRYYSDSFRVYTTNSGSSLVAYDLGSGRESVLGRGQFVGYNHINRGESVVVVQLMLNRYKGYSHIIVDGIFGQGTQSLLCTYQESKGLSVDGISGSRTYDTYLAYLGM